MKATSQGLNWFQTQGEEDSQKKWSCSVSHWEDEAKWYKKKQQMFNWWKWESYFQREHQTVHLWRNGRFPSKKKSNICPESVCRCWRRAECWREEKMVNSEGAAKILKSCKFLILWPLRPLTHNGRRPSSQCQAAAATGSAMKNKHGLYHPDQEEFRLELKHEQRCTVDHRQASISQTLFT